VADVVVIENPILNSPYEEPKKHFRFTDEGITDEIVEERRKSSYFIPIPASKKRGKQQVIDTEWTKDRIEENTWINRVRFEVDRWRIGGRAGVTRTTTRLLDYWTDSARENKLFFCQVEALETVIYIAEVAKKAGDTWIDNDLKRFNQDANPGLFRIALKMATGSGKTVVMAMLIAWQALSKAANPQDARFSDSFLIVTPGITIRDRLRVLLPNDPNNYYRERDLLPPDLMVELHKAKIIITNFHTFKQRETASAGKLTKSVLGADKTSAFTETPDQMVRRVCRELGNKKNIIVINDEAHHCYRRKPDAEEEKLTADQKNEIKIREEEARIWISGLEAVKDKLGIKVVYDLSATPFFLRGSGYQEGTLFPWVVSDFSLIDAIESGIVKVPRVPVADDAMATSGPKYRNLWQNIKAELPKRGRKTDAVSGSPKLPAELEGALLSLYGNYESYFKRWQEADSTGATPPVFIVVCSNTNVSKLVFDWIAGYNKELKDGTKRPVAGNLDLFSNVRDGQWSVRPNTILVDSVQLESGEAMSSDFKKIASTEIEEFKNEFRARFPGRDIDDVSDEDLLREVMNTVGKPGKLGEHIRCVVSVGMLTEGWDANTVTHILGVRAFSTQLLCEQVVGRGLRRMNSSPNEDGMFEPEYAEVYGVPFSFIPAAGTNPTPPKPKILTRVRALEERSDLAIRFPRVIGYRYEMPADRLDFKFTDESKLALSTEDVPSETELHPIVGEPSKHDLGALKRMREQQVAFKLAKLVLEQYFSTDHAIAIVGGNGESPKEREPWLFPQVLEIARRWLDECVVLKDNTFKQMLLIQERAYDAADRIHKAIARADTEGARILPILAPYDAEGSTRAVDFDTAKEVWPTKADKSHVSHVALDSGWEAKLADTLEKMNEVHSYVKNQGLGFVIPYAISGREHSYIPDFIVRYDDGEKLASGEPDFLNVVIEVSGQKEKRDKKAKSETARTLWVPAVNNHGAFGRWMYIEDADPWDAANTLRAAVAEFRKQEELIGAG
jgi:type III restriction enzyme